MSVFRLFLKRLHHRARLNHRTRSYKSTGRNPTTISDLDRFRDDIKKRFFTGFSGQFLVA
jgi:hypothetical protein